MMFCSNCGNQLNDGAFFCSKCGSKITVNVAAVDSAKATSFAAPKAKPPIQKDVQSSFEEDESYFQEADEPSFAEEASSCQEADEPSLEAEASSCQGAVSPSPRAEASSCHEAVAPSLEDGEPYFQEEGEPYSKEDEEYYKQQQMPSILKFANHVKTFVPTHKAEILILFLFVVVFFLIFWWVDVMKKPTYEMDQQASFITMSDNKIYDLEDWEDGKIPISVVDTPEFQERMAKARWGLYALKPEQIGNKRGWDWPQDVWESLFGKDRTGEDDLYETVEIGCGVKVPMYEVIKMMDGKYPSDGSSPIQESSSETSYSDASAPAFGLGIMDYNTAYIDIISQLNEEHPNSKFALIDFLLGDPPELLVDEPGYYLRVFSWIDGSLTPILELPYGAGGSGGYEYLSSANLIRKFEQDDGGATVYELYMTVNYDYELVNCTDEVLKRCFYQDINGNGMKDEYEPYSEEPYYYYGSRELSEQEYAYYQVPGEYRWLSGDLTAAEILPQLYTVFP